MQAMTTVAVTFITPYQALQASNMAEGVQVQVLHGLRLVARSYGWASIGPNHDDAPIPLATWQATKLLKEAREAEVAQRGMIQWGTLSANGAS